MEQKKRTSVHEFSVESPTHGNKNGKVYLNKFEGRVLLIVNVASCWGLTDSNYKGLMELHKRYHEEGLSILAFPCNQFGKQEPGSEEEIQQFAEALGVKFPIFDKIEVNGQNVGNPRVDAVYRTNHGYDPYTIQHYMTL